MDKREQMIRLWFSMWLEKKDLGMDDIFAENVSYTESWGPCYSNRETVKHLNKMLVYNLQSESYGIVSVETVKEAMEVLKSQPFDLVLLDINLPDGDGYAIAKTIRKKYSDTFPFPWRSVSCIDFHHVDFL